MKTPVTTLRVTACILLGIAASVPVATAQDRLAEFFSSRAGPDYEFGQGVAWLGDVDGDGVDDALVAEEGAPPSDAGAVYVISGATGATIRRHAGTDPLARFGRCLAGAEDLDGDGVRDYMAGSNLLPNATREGTTWVYSGATGSVIFKFVGARPGEQLCGSGFLGDLDGDGVSEFGMGAIGGGVGGVAYAYSGATGTPLHTFSGTAGQGLAGIADVGDVDGDGTNDLILSSGHAGPNGEGMAEIYSGATATFLYSLIGERSNDAFGYGGGVGDVDGDGSPDFAVVAPWHDITKQEGRVYVYSGPTGSLIYTFDGWEQDQMFGVLERDSRIDLNGDGFHDILIGSEWGTPSGFVDSGTIAYSGRTGRSLYLFRGAPVSRYFTEGLSWPSSFGDFNHDGIDDVIIGAPRYRKTYSAQGRAVVFAGNDLFLQGNQAEYAAGDSITLSNRGGEPGALSMVALTDLNGTPTFLPIVIGVLDAYGELAISDTVPSGLSGITLTFMGFAQKPGGRGIADSITEMLVFK